MSFERLHETYIHFFDEVMQLKPYYDCVFFMSFDAEWYADNGRNVILTYQIATCSLEKTANIIEYMDHGQRLTLAEIVEKGLRSVLTEAVYNKMGREDILIILVSHSTTAEWSALADRDEDYIMKRIVEVRGSPITDNHPIKLTLTGGVPVCVRIFDTMLLAPASFRSLKKLSALIGSEKDQKEEITQFYIENMNLYLIDHPDKFEQYALKDSEITLRIFFILQVALNMLVGGNFKLYRTLASAGVKSFTDKNLWFKDYRKELTSKFSRENRLASRAYLGGRNESFYSGRTNDYPETKNKIWIDIDFSGCYPTAMALSPKIDTGKEAEYLPRKYNIDDLVAAELVAMGISQGRIDKVRAALAISAVTFDMEMKKLPRNIARNIREKAIVYDNSLFDCWYYNWKNSQIKGDKSIEEISIPGFARIRFEFPPDTKFPCLPIRHPEYGLLYVLKGETTVPAAEIMLAMDAGAEINGITSIEYYVEKEDGHPVRFLLKHLGDLASARKEYKKRNEKVMEQLVKEFTNSFYGKFAQSVTPRNVFSAATGEMVVLGKSNITEPITASLATSLARAALSATLVGIERFNKNKDLADQVTVISATTDGLLIGVPAPENFTVVDDYYGITPPEQFEESGSPMGETLKQFGWSTKSTEADDNYEEPLPKLKKGVENQLSEILKRFNCSEILDEIDKFLPIRQMRHSRQQMKVGDQILEIKHLADEIISIKTRGQIGLIPIETKDKDGNKIKKNLAVLIARFGMKPPLSELVPPDEYKRLMDERGVEKDSKDAEWIIDQLDKKEDGLEEIGTYHFITLNSFKKIAKSQGTLDLTKNISNRRINTDFDWKRRLVQWEDGPSDTKGNTPSISPYTVPYTITAEMLAHRHMVESIRRSGVVAQPENVIHRVKVKSSSLNARGGKPVAVTRLFLKGLLHDIFTLKTELTEHYSELAVRLNDIWDRNELTLSYPKTWTKNDFKNNARKTNENFKWEAGCILPNILLRKLVRDLAEEFTADPDAVEAEIFSLTEYEKINSVLIEYVITAIVNAPKKGINPFCDLQERGLLPTKQKILDTFRAQMSEEQMQACFDQQFVSGGVESFHANYLKKIFYRLGIPIADSEACARCLAPPSQVIRGARKNIGGKKTTDSFVLAILQEDIVNRKLSVAEVVQNLEKYGVTRSKYYRLKKGKFNPNCIKDTQDNRQQISRMAKALHHDPGPLFDVLIER